MWRRCVSWVRGRDALRHWSEGVFRVRSRRGMNRTCAARTNGTLKAVAQSNSGPCGNALCHSWPLVNRVFTLVSIMQWATFSKDVAAPTGIIAQCAARRQHGQYGWETLLLANRLHRRASAGSTTTPLQLTC